MKKCQFCGYEITPIGTLGVEKEYNGKFAHELCLECHLRKKKALAKKDNLIDIEKLLEPEEPPNYIG